MENGYNLYNFEASFKNFLASGNVKPITIKNYLSDLRHFFGWLIFKLKTSSEDKSTFDKKNQNSKIEEKPESFLNLITEALIKEYKNYLYENKIPLKTINRRLSTLRKFFSFCVAQGWLKENPAKKISNIASTTTIDLIDLESFYRQENLNKEEIEIIKEFISFFN